MMFISKILLEGPSILLLTETETSTEQSAVRGSLVTSLAINSKCN